MNYLEISFHAVKLLIFTNKKNMLFDCIIRKKTVALDNLLQVFSVLEICNKGFLVNLIKMRDIFSLDSLGCNVVGFCGSSQVFLRFFFKFIINISLIA